MNIIGIKQDRNYIIDNDAIIYDKPNKYQQTQIQEKNEADNDSKNLLCNQIKDLAFEGKTPHQISKILRCNESYVCKIFIALGMKQRQSKKEIIMRLFKAGKTFEEIIEISGAAEYYVKVIWNEYQRCK